MRSYHCQGDKIRECLWQTMEHETQRVDKGKTSISLERDVDDRATVKAKVPSC